MQITDYIPVLSDIRAVMGVSVKELKDAVITSQVFGIQLEEKLENLHEALPDVYAELVKKAKDNQDDPNNPAPTKLEKKVIGLTQVLSAYYVALLIAPTLPVFGMRKITDGKAEQERQTTAFDELKADLSGQITDLEDELLEKLEDLGQVIVPVQATYFLGTSTLVQDPVTGA